MGGLASAIKNDTKDIILESAFFMPQAVQGLAKHYNLSSDASYRFERGVDPKLIEIAGNYAASLILNYCGGSIDFITIVDNLPSSLAKTVTLEYNQIYKLLGISLDELEVRSILTRLGFEIIKSNITLLEVKVPSFRWDINISQDLIEEIARVYGYDKIPSQLPLGPIKALRSSGHLMHELKLKLIDLGFSEIISYAFLEPKFEQMLGLPGVKAVTLQNPIADLRSLRTSLLADLIKALMNNIRFGHKRVKIFEIAKVFYGTHQDEERLKLGALIYGETEVVNWRSLKKKVDFFDLKQDLLTLFPKLEQAVFVPTLDYPLLHSGRCAKILSLNQEVGIIGQLHPKFMTLLDLDELPYIFELDLKALEETLSLATDKIHKFNRLPKVIRDLVFITKDTVLVQEIISTIWEMGISNLLEIKVFDIYQGPNIAPTFKSVGFTFIFQGIKTLTDEEVASSLLEVINLLHQKFEMTLRK
jgi:phenylalanyl-tRNA synthetase beta chain